MKRNFGRFFVSDVYVKNNPEEIKEVLKQLSFIPLRVEYLAYKDEYEYIGYSPRFRELSVGQSIIDYKIICTRKKVGECEGLYIGIEEIGRCTDTSGKLALKANLDGVKE